jgi:hypothetical protein
MNHTVLDLSDILQVPVQCFQAQAYLLQVLPCKLA